MFTSKQYVHHHHHHRGRRKESSPSLWFFLVFLCVAAAAVVDAGKTSHNICISISYAVRKNSYVPATFPQPPEPSTTTSVDALFSTSFRANAIVPFSASPKLYGINMKMFTPPLRCSVTFSYFLWCMNLKGVSVRDLYNSLNYLFCQYLMDLYTKHPSIFKIFIHIKELPY